jgi:cytochrome P450
MLTATLVFLAIHQDIQEKVYAEIMTVFKDDSVELNVDNIQKLTYLKMCIDEALRLFPPVPQISRVVVNEKFYVGLAKKIKVGTQIHVLTSVLHRRKDIWGENADEFKPERFSEENCEARDPYSYAPFGHVS